MASFSSLGIGSGLDLTSLVNNLVSAERAATDTRLFSQESKLSTELSGVGLMRSALSGFQSSLSGFDNAENFSTRKISNTNPSDLTATASNTAALGSYTLDVDTLASVQSVASTAYTAIDSEVGTGEIQITFGSITGTDFSTFVADTENTIQTITIDSSNNTLSGLRDHINSNEFGITAAIVNDGSGYRLTLTSNDTGANAAMEIVIDDDDLDDTDTDGLSNLAYNLSAQNVAETQAAADASLTVNGLTVSSSTNILTDVIEGVTLTLNRAMDDGETSQIVVSEDTSEVFTAIGDLVDGYNDMISTLNDLGSSDVDNGQIGILVGNPTLRSFISQARNLITSPVDGLDGEVRALADIGITSNLDGTLAIDSALFEERVKDNPFDALALFAPVGQASDSLITYGGSSEITKEGVYAVNITQLATQAEFNGDSVLGSFPVVIDSDNDEFSIIVDGVSSGTLSIPLGSYASGDDLADEIQILINSSSLFEDADVTVDVSFDSTNTRLDFKSAKYGSESTIAFSAVDTNSAADLGFSVASGTDGVDVAGTVGGVSGSGEGQTLTIETGDPTGISITVQGSNSGNRGNITFVRGFVDSLDAILESYLDTAGVLTAKEDSINSQLEGIVDERAALELRMEAVQARYVRQFTQLDILIAQFQQTGSFLASTLASLPGSGQLLNDN